MGLEKPTEVASYLTSLKTSVQVMQLKENSFLQIELLESCAALIVVLDGEIQLWWNFLQKFRQRYESTPLILVVSQFQEEVVRKAINQFHAFQILLKNSVPDQLAQKVELAIRESDFQRGKNHLIRDSVLQNRKLEALTTSLEEKVEERTLHLKESNQELSEKLSRERHVIRFIKDIAAQSSIEDFLQIFRKEIRQFHRIGEPILILKNLPGQVSLSYFKSSRYVYEEMKTRAEFLSQPAIDEDSLKQGLATMIARPLAKSFFYPLELQASTQENKALSALLLIEHALNKDEVTAFDEFIQDRLQALSIALDRIVLEEQLEVFSFRWAKTFDGLKDPLAIINHQYDLIAANKGFLHSGSEKKCYEIFAHRKSPCEGCPMQRSLESKSPQESQLAVLGKEYRVLSYPIRASEASAVTSVVHHYTDRTEEKELYLHLVQSEKMSALGALAGNIAHELNNPLSGIRSLVQVLQKEIPTTETQTLKDLEEIEKAAARSQKIIKNLLEFARGSSIEGEVISIDQIIEKTLPMLKTALRMHRLKLSLHSQSPRLKVEPHLIQQVIYNLVNNACQAMVQIGDLTIESWESETEVGFKVSDTGPGMSDTLKEKIFTPFFTTKAEGVGTGLGLSLVKSIVERYSGQITVEDVKPQGARFVVRFPI